MPIPNNGDKYDSPALFSAADAIDGQGGDTGVEIPKAVIITYQRDFFEKILAERTGDPIPIVRDFEVHPIDETVGVVVGFSIGAPATGTVAENLIAAGAEALCIVGGSGTLQRSIEPTDAIISDEAIRDEGVSYHYLPPEAEAEPSPELTERLEARFEESEVPTHRGTTWTTSAFYRETVAEIEEYADAGVVSVEMEAAALFAVAEFRGVDAAAVFDIGDLLTGEEWDPGIEYENVQPKLLDPAIAALHDHLNAEGSDADGRDGNGES
ncbi:purine or other phosphorylase family 1 [Haladaptatus paucihalophilus DX253]|uniref:Phosphorylase superfamily protein n=1 Tax=Haladaptatus paucihalophilus DX253 TaxID=797209 RepID=E7QR59_HALPU|nr:nucleoside phosphorylase [Haladaptatus paucihalophilus]EFW92967.1 purine or other phosphorylase family 1 [Haladaptatus paucihalophilus DX253]SHL17974.1 Phosphorylase superfamily protein [Haladaptatus paucihalophilus DX253]